MSDTRIKLNEAANQQDDDGPLLLLNQIIAGEPNLFEQVLSFCIFEDIGALRHAGTAMRNTLLVGACAKELDRLGEALMEACFMNYSVKLETLLAERKVPADLVVGNTWKGLKCPLSVATMRGNHRIVERLLLAGADVNWKNEVGTTCLDLAVVRRSNHENEELPPLSPSASLDETIKILKANGGHVSY